MTDEDKAAFEAWLRERRKVPWLLSQHTGPLQDAWDAALEYERTRRKS